MEARHVVLGGLGFLGNELVRELVRARRAVVVVDTPQRLVTAKSIGRFVPLHFVPVRSLADAPILTLFHAGDYVVDFWNDGSPGSCPAPQRARRKDGVYCTLVMLREAAKVGVTRVVFASSGGAVYGHSSALPIPENCPTCPVSSYGLLKLQIEQILEEAHASVGLDYMILRFGNVYGPGSLAAGGQNLISTACKCAINSEQLAIWGDGTSVRDYVYIKDVVAATLLSCCCKAANTPVNIGTGVGTSVARIIELVEQTSGRAIRTHHEPQRSCDVTCNVLDISKAYSMFGWRPAMAVQDGITETWRALIGSNGANHRITSALRSAETAKHRVAQ